MWKLKKDIEKKTIFKNYQLINQTFLKDFFINEEKSKY